MPGYAGAGLPEVSERLVIPEQIAKGFFIQFRDADAIRVWLRVLIRYNKFRKNKKRHGLQNLVE